MSAHYTREEAQKLLGETISAYEWSCARQHARFPGVLKPVEVIKYSRSRFKVEQLADFLGFLGDQLQSTAYGDKNVQLSTGVIAQLDNVHTSSTNDVIKEYYAQQNPNALSEDVRCTKRHPKLNKQCYLPKERDSQCDFTSAMVLSQSSLEMLINELTSGQLNSLAGLDDEDVLKGRNSIERLVEIYESLSVALDHDEQTTKSMKMRIDIILKYHKTDFKKHVKKNGERSCECISCGLTSKEEPIPVRNVRSHSKFTLTWLILVVQLKLSKAYQTSRKNCTWNLGWK